MARSARGDDGALGPPDWAGMVERCRRCDWLCGCKALADRQIRAGQRVRAPHECFNRARVTALRAPFPEVA